MGGGLIMKLDSPKNKIPLNKVTHSVRASQAVLQYGVGAMVDFPNQTLMTAAPEFWSESVVKIHDERLEKVLKVDYFGLPEGRISYVRFPEWYFCPKCRKFKPLKEWIADYKKRQIQKKLAEDPDMIKHMKCPTCKQDLVVARIITACEHGHIDDFPWIKWVHCKNVYGAKKICDHPSLTLKTGSTSSGGLEGIIVSCETCGARASLKGAFDKDALKDLDQKYEGEYNFHCTGKHPWKHTKDNCSAYPKVLQRGSSSVYFPVTLSSLVIPPYSSLITKKIENSMSFSRCLNSIADCKRNNVLPKELLPAFIKNTMDNYTQDIALEIGLEAEKIYPILERKLLAAPDDSDYMTTSVKYREEEYEALSGEVTMSESDGDFLREGTEIAKYKIPYVKNISLVHKVREVQALIGFSRLNPVEADMGEISSENIVSVKQPETNWYPAYEVRGEGIFIEFDENAISEWQKSNPQIQHRVDILNGNYQQSFIGQSRPRKITAKFLLLHTVSHALIKQLSFECGYSIASLKERLYCSDNADGKQMSGIFIYTASGDSEGTLGGLVRQGRADIFPGIFRKAMEEAMTCSNDPVCSLSMGQGRDSLNLSACYSCSLIPETSCEEFNTFLDRGTIVGTYENRKMGFYSKQLSGAESWENIGVAEKPKNTSMKNKINAAVIGIGTDLRDSNYKDIWNSLRPWLNDEKEIALLDELEKNESFSQKEKPYANCIFQISGDSEQYMCDLFWKESDVAFFTSDNEDGYLAAKDSNIQCFYSSDSTVTPEKILEALKER